MYFQRGLEKKKEEKKRSVPVSFSQGCRSLVLCVSWPRWDPVVVDKVMQLIQEIRYNHFKKCRDVVRTVRIMTRVIVSWIHETDDTCHEIFIFFWNPMSLENRCNQCKKYRNQGGDYKSNISFFWLKGEFFFTTRWKLRIRIRWKFWRQYWYKNWEKVEKRNRIPKSEGDTFREICCNHFFS